MLHHVTELIDGDSNQFREVGGNRRARRIQIGGDFRVLPVDDRELLRNSQMERMERRVQFQRMSGIDADQRGTALVDGFPEGARQPGEAGGHLILKKDGMAFRLRDAESGECVEASLDTCRW